MRDRRTDQERIAAGEINMSDPEQVRAAMQENGGAEIRGAARVVGIVSKLFDVLRDQPDDFSVVWDQGPIVGKPSAAPCFSCRPDIREGVPLLGYHYATAFGVFFYSEDHAEGCTGPRLLFLTPGSYGEQIIKAAVAG